MNETINIKDPKLSVTDLKAMAYDWSVTINIKNQELSAINEEIGKRLNNITAPNEQNKEAGQEAGHDHEPQETSQEVVDSKVGAD